MPTITSTPDPLGRPYNLVEVDWSDVVDAYIPGGLNLPGVSGSYASASDSSKLDISGDLDVRAEATTAWTAPGTRILVSKYNTVGNQRSWYLGHSAAGLLELGWSANGIALVNVNSTVAPTPSPDGRLAVRATFDVDNGAGGNDVTFYTAPDISGPWTQLGAVVTTAGVASLFNSSAVVVVGGINTGTSALIVGTVHSVQIRDGLNGTVVGFPRFDQQPTGTTVFVDQVATQWTVSGSAYITEGIFGTGPVGAVAVYRVDAETCARTSLRPYVCYEGNCLGLSCDGTAIFWDTEVPFDREYYYITEACPAQLTEGCALDTFTRVETDTWGTTDNGYTWGAYSGALADFDVDGAQGLMTLPAASTIRATFVDIGDVDQDVYAEFRVTELSTGASQFASVMGRATSVDDGYRLDLEFATTNAVTASLSRVVGGVTTVIATAINIGTATLDSRWTLKLRVLGDTILGKAWVATGSEPSNWQLVAADAAIAVGTLAGLRAATAAGNTNAPVTFGWDNFSACPACVGPTAVTAQTEQQTTVSDGRFWLKDPVRPCHDRPVPLCPSTAPVLPVCGGSGGIAFIEISVELYASNGSRVRPMNRRRPIPITRPRADVTTSLVLQTLTFDDRDDVLQMVAPGSPLLFQGPPEYGVPDRYMDIATVEVARRLPDHRIQLRTLSLPYEAVNRPAGPTQGICGNRVRDMCNVYPTIADMEVAGVTWGGLVRGEAGGALDA